MNRAILQGRIQSIHVIEETGKPLGGEINVKTERGYSQWLPIHIPRVVLDFGLSFPCREPQDLISREVTIVGVIEAMPWRDKDDRPILGVRVISFEMILS